MDIKGSFAAAEETTNGEKSGDGNVNDGEKQKEVSAPGPGQYRSRAVPVQETC